MFCPDILCPVYFVQVYFVRVYFVRVYFVQVSFVLAPLPTILEYVLKCYYAYNNIGAQICLGSNR